MTYGRTDYLACWFPRCVEPSTHDCHLCSEPSCAKHAPKHFAAKPRQEAA